MATRGLSSEQIQSALELRDDDSIIEGISDEDDSISLTAHAETPQEGGESSSEYSSDDEVPLSTFSAPQPSQMNRRIYWKHLDDFAPSPPGVYHLPLASSHVRVLQTPFEYFTRYIPEKIFEIFSSFSNQTYLHKTGKNLGTTKDEMKIFFGICIAMSYLGLPRIKMYWMSKTRIPMIADRMTRDRFFRIRTNLKLVNDLDVDTAAKQNKFWKVQPLIETVRKACLENPRPQEVSIDEQIIPFWGQVSMRQFIRGKPNPCGLKNFVCTSPGGIPLDFFLYEGKGDSILPTGETEGLDIGGKVVMRLANNLPEGSKLYMDRYFTSIELLDKLYTEKKMQGTGTLKKSKIPKACNFKTDKQLKDQGRGSSDQLVRNDGVIACLKWFDNKPVVMASSADSKLPENKCRRWCKKTKQYIEINRPYAIQQYNENMGGVDMLDRVISFYRISARSKKWTVRLIFHLFDFAAAAGWLVYRKEAQMLDTPKKGHSGLLGVQSRNSKFFALFHSSKRANTPVRGS
ncbi:unnamed protein product [Parnassius apollo]|uniref:(apollo) hypothetical protein n=1 Tax=Parnassius apollo TaxID=110799 RepID=A0A8S3WSP1_PARAO|nr:unnamed protein product [Parnassius apollo]